MTAFVPGYTYDVFISYAHVDNLTAKPNTPGWVTQFRQYLEVKLAQSFGRGGMVQIWLDEKLDGSQLFDEVIQNRINQAAIFLSLTSKGYLQSTYCDQELQWFMRKAQAEPIGLRIGERWRIFNILLYNFDHEVHEKWPQAFGRTGPFKFHEAAEQGRPGESLDPASRMFQTRLGELVESINWTLTEFANLHRPSYSLTSSPPNEPPGAPCDVYLAEVADSLRTLYKRVSNELSQQGIKVYAQKIPPPYESEAHQEAVITTMQNARLSVHLLDGLAGTEIDWESGITYPQKQVKLGQKHAACQLLWVPRTLQLTDIDDGDQKMFLDDLENGQRGTAQYDFIRGSPSEIVREIAEKLEQLRSPAPLSVLPPAVLLDTHIKDQLFALEMTRMLLDKKIRVCPTFYT